MREPNSAVRDLTLAAISRDPLAWLAALCDQRRRLSGLLDAIADGLDPDAPRAVPAIAWLHDDFTRLFRDEADDLFPLLRSRARRDDDFAPIMQRLESDHDSLAGQARNVLAGLAPLRVAKNPASREAGLVAGLRDLADRDRLHCAMLCAVILPIARLRLEARDLMQLSAALQQRRAPS